MAGTVPKSWFLAAGAVAQLAAAQSEDEWKALLAQAAAQMSCPVKQRSVQVRFPPSQCWGSACFWASRGGIHEHNIWSSFLGKDSSLLRLEC
jgi:hypothetical protein